MKDEINSNIFERMMQIAIGVGCKNTNDLAKFLGYKSPEKLYRLERDRTAKPSVDIISDFSNKFESADMNWVLTGKERSNLYPHLSGSTGFNPLSDETKKAYTPNDNDALHVVSEHETTYNAPPTLEVIAPPNAPAKQILVPQYITVDKEGEENILYVTVRAAAGYLNGYADREYLGKLPSFRLPGLTNGTYRMFEVDGDSMSPTLENKWRVIGKWITSLDDIKEDHVHIIVTKTRGIVIKRLLNRIDKYGYIIAKSDAVDNRHLYPNIEIAPDEILEVWLGTIFFGNSFRHPKDMYQRINNLEADLTEVMRMLKSNNLLSDTSKP